MGTYEGFNFRRQAAIEHTLTVDEVLDWDHDADGEAEFWPAGDCAILACLFSGRNAVTGSELQDVIRILDEAGRDEEDTLLRLHFLVNLHGCDLGKLSGSEVEDMNLHVFRGDSFIDLRRDAAFELFELYWPELYALWEKTSVDGLLFDSDYFLDSPSWTVEELDLGTGKVLLVAAA